MKIEKTDHNISNYKKTKNDVTLSHTIKQIAQMLKFEISKPSSLTGRISQENPKK
jgi:hypothetical protein